MRLSRAVLCFLVFGFVSQIVYYYPNLPEIVATHFNISGEPDGWMSKQSFLIGQALLLVVIVFEFTLLPFLISKMPDSLINLPNKEYWLADERRVETFRTIRHYFEWLGVALLALFIAVNQLVFEANLTRRNLSETASWLILGVFLTFTTIWLIKFIKHFRK